MGEEHWSFLLYSCYRFLGQVGVGKWFYDFDNDDNQLGNFSCQYSFISGKLTPALKKRVLIAGGLLGFQGLLGWYNSRKSNLEIQIPPLRYMVKSGLDHNNFLGPCDVPRVSQYRLAAHLSSAVVLYSFLFWSAKSVLRPSITWSQVHEGLKSAQLDS